jgi:integration host factor subunit beta
MTKSELIAEIAAAQPHLRAADVELIVSTVWSGIADALARGDRVELRGFGRFEIRHRAARQGRNPKTGTPVDVSAKIVAHFKAGRDLRQRLNRKAPVRHAAVARS